MIHQQSDYGYEIGGIEHRDFATCVAKIKSCRVYARQYKGTQHEAVFKAHAKEWVREAKWYRNLRATDRL